MTDGWTVDYFLSFLSLHNVLGATGALFYVISMSMKTAANGKDKGCFSIDLPKMPAAIKALMMDVAQIKAKGDKARAEVLIKEYVDVTGDKKKLHDVITERITRAPKASFVYYVKLD